MSKYATCRLLYSLLPTGIAIAVSLATGLTPAVGVQSLIAWPLAGPSETLLGFGEPYRCSSGEGRSHMGLDLLAEAGDRVVAPVEGVVTFCGSVPSAMGGVLRAVTLKTVDGELVTLSPLERLVTQEGAHVEAGDQLGTLAAAGDPSCASTHLHLSLRAAGEYVDPDRILRPPVSAAQTPSPCQDRSGVPVAPEVNAPPAASGLTQRTARPTTGPLYASEPVCSDYSARPAWASVRVRGVTSLPVLMAEAMHRESIHASSGGGGTPHLQHPAQRTPSRLSLRLGVPPDPTPSPVLFAAVLLLSVFVMWGLVRAKGARDVSHRWE